MLGDVTISLLGLPDTPLNQKVAEAKAKLIESDITLDRFDVSLAKYKPKSVLSTVTPTVTPNCETAFTG